MTMLESVDLKELDLPFVGRLRQKGEAVLLSTS